MNTELLQGNWSTGAKQTKKEVETLRNALRRNSYVDYWPRFYRFWVKSQNFPDDAVFNTDGPGPGDYYSRVPFQWLLRFFYNFPEITDGYLFVNVWEPVRQTFLTWEKTAANPEKIYVKINKKMIPDVSDYWERVFRDFVSLIPPKMKTREWMIDNPNRLLNMPENTYPGPPSKNLYKPVQHAIAIIDSFGYETEYMRFPDLKKAMRDICESLGMDPETGKIYNVQRTRAVLSAVPKYTPLYKTMLTNQNRDSGDYGRPPGNNDNKNGGGFNVASLIGDPVFLVSAALGFLLIKKMKGKK